MNLSVVNLTDMCERKSQTKKSAVLFLYHFKVAELFCTELEARIPLAWSGRDWNGATEAFHVTF